MATLEKIRRRGVLLIVVVGFALIAFIVGDFLTQGSTFFSQNREIVAEVNGDDTKIAEYQDLLDQIVIFQKYETGQTDIDEQTMQQMRAYLWDQFVREKLLWDEAKKMGLTVTHEELTDRLIGNNIHPLIQQRRFFADESGRFNRSLLVQFLNFKDEEHPDPQMQQSLEEYKKLWIFLEKTVKTSLLQEKYNVLLSNAVVANSIEAKLNYDANASILDLNYIVQPYFTIADSAVTISNKEIKDRYNAQIKKYRQEPNVSMRFVSFNIQPSEEDYKNAEEYINKLSEEFRSSEDFIELVNTSSDIPYNGRNYTQTTVPVALRDFAFSGKQGDVTGPVFVNNAYTMARIVETGILQPDSVELKHIFLMTADESKTDSIITAIRGGANFGELAKKYSAVKQTAENDGLIGWIQDGDPTLDKEILKNAFAGSVNQVFTFKNAQGTQIIQINNRTAPRSKVKLAILERSVIASSQTESKIFNEAKRFAADLKAVNFDSIARKNNYIVRQANEVFQTNEQVLDIPQSRQIVRWAFENSEDKVSDVFECDKQLIVAVISDVNKSKYRDLSKVTEQIRAEIMRDKKADMIISQLSDKVGSDTALVQLAASIGQEVKKATGVTFDGFQFGMAGFEPAVIGKASSMNLNQVSAPVKGNAGVYVLAVTNVQQSEAPFDAAAAKIALASRFSYAIPNSIIMDMMDKADIKDNRLNFY